MTARELIDHCREKAKQLKVDADEVLQLLFEPEISAAAIGRKVDALRREAAELNRAANEAEWLLGGHPYWGHDPGAAYLIERETRPAELGRDYDAEDAHYRANATRAARVLKAELERLLPCAHIYNETCPCDACRRVREFLARPCMGIPEAHV